jgi:hypothetical protein
MRQQAVDKVKLIQETRDFCFEFIKKNARRHSYLKQTSRASCMSNYTCHLGKAENVTGRRLFTMTTCDTVVSSLEEALKAIASDSSPAYTRLEKELVGPKLDVIQADVLDAIKPRTKESPYDYIGLKQVTYQSLMNSNIQEQFTLVESIGKSINPSTEKPFVYKMLRSYEPDHDVTSSSTSRGILYCMMLILRETKSPGILKMELYMDIESPAEAKETYSALHDSYTLAMRYRQVIEAFSQETSSFSLTRIKKSGGTKKKKKNTCQVCEKRLGTFLLTKRHECILCSAIVCGACLSEKDKTCCTTCVYHRKGTLTSTQTRDDHQNTTKDYAFTTSQWSDARYSMLSKLRVSTASTGKGGVVLLEEELMARLSRYSTSSSSPSPESSYCSDSFFHSYSENEINTNSRIMPFAI